MNSFELPNVPEKPENISEEAKREQEMDEWGLTPTEWEVFNLFSNLPDLDDAESLAEAKNQVQEWVRADYEEFGQGDLTEMIEQDAEYKFDEALSRERRRREAI